VKGLHVQANQKGYTDKKNTELGETRGLRGVCRSPGPHNFIRLCRFFFLF